MSNNARQTSFNALIRIERNNAYSNIAVDSQLTKAALDAREAALATALTLGVVNKKLTLDCTLSHYLSKPLKKLSPELLTVLRLGAFQILFMDRIPSSAAVNESVKLAKSCGCAYAGGLVNAVLRKIAGNGIYLPDGVNSLERISAEYSVPEKMLKFIFSSIGEDNTVPFLTCAGQIPAVIRVNTLKTTSAELAEKLSERGVQCKYDTPFAGACEIISADTPIQNLDLFKDGLFHIQGTASQLAATIVEAHPGDTVIDLCAAPGGKSFTIAEQMNNIGRVISCDISPVRTELIRSGAQRLGIECIEATVNDAAVFNPEFPAADCVLCDVPCSGLGVIGKKPEIKYKNPDDFESLYPIQRSIINTASRYVKPGGRLVYSTCTVNPKENRDVCTHFLAENPSFTAIGFSPDYIRTDADKPFLTLLPNVHNCDGFFVAVFEKSKEK